MEFNTIYKTELLCDYMEIRSEVNGEDFDKGYILKNSEGLFNVGCRNFFGVLLDDDGNVLSDEQQPYEGFVDNFHKVFGWLKDDNYTPTDEEWNELKKPICDCGECDVTPSNDMDEK